MKKSLLPGLRAVLPAKCLVLLIAFVVPAVSLGDDLISGDLARASGQSEFTRIDIKSLDINTNVSAVLKARSPCAGTSMSARWQITAEALTPLTLTLNAEGELPELTLWDSFHTLIPFSMNTSNRARVRTFNFVTPLDGQVLVRVKHHLTCQSVPYSLKLLEIAALPNKDNELDIAVLIVTVSQSELAPGRPLPGVAFDGPLIKDMFVTQFGVPSERILTLPKTVDRFDLVKSIRNHLGRVSENGTAVLYFSGHGTQYIMRSAAGDDEPNDHLDEALVLSNTVMLDNELKILLGRLAVEKVLFIVDACHAGGTERHGGATLLEKQVPFAELNAQPYGFGARSALELGSRNFVLLAATGESAPAYTYGNVDGSSKGPSLFTEALTRRWPEVLRSDPNMHFSRLIEVVGADVFAKCCDDGRTSLQRPMIGSKDGIVSHYVGSNIKVQQSIPRQSRGL